MTHLLLRTSRRLWVPCGAFVLVASVVALGVGWVATASVSTATAQSADQPPQAAPIADVSGPGQSLPQPPAECPRTISCVYSEQNLLPSGYRLQSLRVCGANCTTQYWVASGADGTQLLEIDPVRGGALLAVSRAGRSSDHPSVRVVTPTYAAGDPACCPSSFSDTTYTWDDTASTLVPTEPVVTPADQFPGYDATRQELLAEGWLVASI